MALPTLEKTWQFNVNQRIAFTTNLATTASNALAALVSTLTGFANSPWTVYSQQPNPWSLPPPPTKIAWIVLEQSGMSTSGLKLLINGWNNSMAPAAATGGFSGGSDTVYPTAPGAQLSWLFTGLGTLSNWVDPTVGTDLILHVMHTSDGSQTRVVVCSNSKVYSTLTIGNLGGAVDTSAGLWAAMWSNNTAAGGSIANLSEMTNKRTKGGSGTLLMQGAYTVDGNRNSNTPETLAGANDISGFYPIFRMGYQAIETSGLVLTEYTTGRHGYVVDTWFGANGVGVGDTYPASGSKQFVQFDNLILPWDGSTPVIT